MRKVRISDLKNQLSRYLDFVRKGESIEVLDRDIPVALIVSISEAQGKLRDGRLLDLERKGVLRIGDPSLAEPLQKTAPPGKRTGALKALLQEREDSR